MKSFLKSQAIALPILCFLIASIVYPDSGWGGVVSLAVSLLVVVSFLLAAFTISSCVDIDENGHAADKRRIYMVRKTAERVQVPAPLKWFGRAESAAIIVMLAYTGSLFLSFMYLACMLSVIIAVMAARETVRKLDATGEPSFN